MGTQITFGRRTWKAKWSRAEEYIQYRQLKVQIQCQLQVKLWVSRSSRAAGTDLHNEGDVWHSQLMHIQRYSRSQGLSWKLSDFQTHAVRDIKAHGWLCSVSLPRGTSSSCYFGFAPQINFKALDAWDIYAKPGAEAVRRPCLTVVHTENQARRPHCVTGAATMNRFQSQLRWWSVTGWPKRKVSLRAIGFNWKPKIASLIKLDTNDVCKNTAGNKLNYIRQF